MTKKNIKYMILKFISKEKVLFIWFIILINSLDIVIFEQILITNCLASNALH